MGAAADTDVTSTVRSLYDRVLNGEKVTLSEWRTAKEAAQYASASVCFDGTRFPEMDVTEFAAMRNAVRAAEEAAEIPKSEAFNDSCFARSRGAEAAIAAKEAVGKAEAAIQAAEAEWEAGEEEDVKGWKAVANYWWAYYLRIDGKALENEDYKDPDTKGDPDHDWADEESTRPDPCYQWDGEYPPTEANEVSYDDVFKDPYREVRDAEVAAMASDIRAHREAKRYAETAAIAAKSAERAPVETEANWRRIADRLLEIITECALDQDVSRYLPTMDD